MSSVGRQFRELFCEHFHCAPEAYETNVFWRCLHRRSLPLSAVIYWFHPGFFHHDFAAIRQIGVTLSEREFLREVDEYAFTIKSYGNVVQRRFRVRVSGQRLIRLSKLFRAMK